MILFLKLCFKININVTIHLKTLNHFGTFRKALRNISKHFENHFGIPFRNLSETFRPFRTIPKPFRKAFRTIPDLFRNVPKRWHCATWDPKNHVRARAFFYAANYCIIRWTGSSYKASDWNFDYWWCTWNFRGHFLRKGTKREHSIIAPWRSMMNKSIFHQNMPMVLVNPPVKGILYW